MKRLIVICALWLIGSSAVKADNWPHWRGDQGNGISTAAKPPTEWSDSKNVKWKVAIPGLGSGSPCIWEDEVFVVSAVSVDGTSEANSVTNLEFRLYCVDRKSGDIKWQKTAATGTPHERTHRTNSFASASPCTDGQHVYAHFGSQGLFCYALDGSLIWKRTDLGKMRTRNQFGEGSSPTLAGGMVIVPWDHEGQSHLFALDQSTGKTIWKVDRDEPTCWATPLIVEHAGKKQIIMNGQTCARAYDLKSGAELWRCAGQTQRPVASAVYANGIAYLMSGFRGSFLGAFRLDGSGDIEGTDKVAWTMARDTPDLASPVLSEGRLYFYKGKSGVLTCVDAKTGKPHYQGERIPGLRQIYASPIAAGGYVFLTGRSGTTVVIKDSNELEIVATNSVGETVDATPAPVDNELFIRGQRHLFCIAE